MRDAECVPEHNVGIVNRSVAVGNPFGDTAGRLAGCLGDVAACGEDLFIVVYEMLEVKYGTEVGCGLTFCDMDSVTGKAGSFPY